MPSLSLLTLNIANPSVERAQRQLEWLASRDEDVFGQGHATIATPHAILKRPWGPPRARPIDLVVCDRLYCRRVRQESCQEPPEQLPCRTRHTESAQDRIVRRSTGHALTRGHGSSTPPRAAGGSTIHLASPITTPVNRLGTKNSNAGRPVGSLRPPVRYGRLKWRMFGHGTETGAPPC